MSIATEITRLQNAKASIKTSIESKGVTVPSATKLDGYSTLIDSIQTGITPTGTISITTNDTYDVTNYASAVVNVPNPSTGTISITTNGTVDVTNYASADVNVPTGITIQEMANGTKPSGILDITGLSFIGSAFKGRTGITGVTGTGTVASNLFESCSNLENIHVSITSGSGQNTVFTGCTKLETAVLVNSVDFGNAKFHSCSKLKTADFGCPRIRTNEFYNCYLFDTLILRSTSIVPMENAGPFTNTKFKSGGAGGTIYIPKVLYDHLGDNSSSDYQHATNWSTVYGYGTITWAKIEGSIYETQYADGTPIGA